MAVPKSIKKAVAGVIPDEIIHREKMGFAAPMAMAEGDFGKQAEIQLLGSKLLQDYGFNRDYLTSLLQDHQRKRVDRSLLIWTLFNPATWHVRWCDRLTTIMFTSEFASDRAMLKVGVPAILFLLILGVGCERGVGFVNYYGEFRKCVDAFERKSDERAFASIWSARSMPMEGSGPPIQGWHWVVPKGCDQGSIAALFHADHQLVSMNRSWFLCRLSEVVLLSERVKSIYAYLFLSQYHANGVCDAPNVLKSAYYTHLASSLDRAFGPNETICVSELQRQRLEKLLQQK